MKILLNVFILLSLVICSCETKQLLDQTLEMTDDAAIAAEIVGEIGGSGYGIFFNTSENHLTGDTTRYITLKVKGETFLQFSAEKKFIYASYCATQLYRRLDPEVIKANSAIKIIFNEEEDIFDGKTYYFEKMELVAAWNAFQHIDAYLNFLSNTDSIGALTQIDTTYSQLDFDSLNREVRNKLGASIVKTSNFYERIEYSYDDSTKNVNCFSISTKIFSPDSSAIFFGFLIPINEADNKIINIHPEG